MTDPERDLREMMNRAANGVHHVPRPSRRLVRRARLRRARTTALAGTAALALVIGGFAASRSLLSAQPTRPANPPDVGQTPTTEHGQAPPEPYSILDGKVTFSRPSRWEQSFAGPWALWLDDKPEERIYMLADPLPIETICRPGPAPADAEALARSIRSDPDLEATEPVAVPVGGVEAMRMDVVAATGASGCREKAPGVVREADTDEADEAQATIVVGGGSFPVPRTGRHQMRLYLLDLPGRSAQILAIAIVAPESRFERVIDAAAPILDSFEFRTE